MINIPAASLKEASKLLNRVRFARGVLPVLTHILATAGQTGVTLAVTDLDQWLETRVPNTGPGEGPESFLIPADALSAALKADKGSTVSFARKGPKGNRVVRLCVTCGGMPVQTSHPTRETEEFPECPVLEGPVTVIPARTIEVLGMVAPCASTDETRYELNGVFFTPEDGGMLVATDGKHLAGAPATVPGREFILPSEAVKVLGHPDFRNGPVTVTLPEPPESPEENERQLVCFQSGNHTLVSKTIEGNYPSWRQVMPNQLVASATIAENRRPALIAWLRSLHGTHTSVNLTRGKRGVLVLTHAHRDGAASTIEVPVETTGDPPPVALDPALLAGALEIAPTLWITDALTPVIARRADGIFCVVMPMRPTGPAVQPAETPAPREAQPVQAAA